VADTAIDARIEMFLTDLRMPSVRRSFRKIAKQVAQQGGDYVAYLHALLEEEVHDQRARSIDRRIQDAKLPQIKELSDLQADTLPKGVSLAQIADLAKGDYLREKANVIAIGGSGTGKSHVCIGLAVEACRQNQRARFYTAVDLASELEEAQEQHLLLRFLKRFASWDVVVVDELGYLPLTERGAELLFQAFSARHEHGSIILNSNLAFGEWTQVFRTERLAVAMLDRVTHRAHRQRAVEQLAARPVAMLDRVTHRAHVLEMNGESFRLRSARSRAKARLEMA
jgi:DNA replication protein DnaC